MDRLVNACAKSILIYIKAMKEYARIIIQGIEKHGGYAIDNTAEGALKAQALIEGDRFLYGGGVGHFISSIN